MGALFATFGINANLLLIQAVNFGVTLLVLWYFLYTPLLKVIAARKEKVAKGVADAQLAERSRQEIEASRSGILSAAEKEAEGVLGRAVEEGKTERAAIVKNAQDRSEALLMDARNQADEARRRALADSEKDIARMAVLAAERILRGS